MLTASFAAFFMAEDEKAMRDKESQNIQKLTLIEQRLLMLEAKLDTLLSDEQKKKLNNHQE